ncbi:MAG: murein biosynthesis integral membrane protein MurJ [Alphaproteobacteria bacterium]|nr:murein biosynthesis integral membrane protein MurJ [Alphaproteobacteria bacterium]
MKLIKAMATVAGLTGISRIFGFIRDVVTAALMGAGPVADAFFVALKLPNLFRRITAEGAFSVSFVPIYAEKLKKEGDISADAFAGNAFAMMLLFLVPFTLLAMLAMPWVIYAIAPGFHDGEVRYDLAVELSRITFPYLLLMSLTSLLGGVMNAHDRFAPYAAAPIFFNLCMMIGIVVFTPVLETPGHALAWGVFAAGVVQLIWMFACMRRANISFNLRLPRFDADIKRLFILMGPGILGAGVVHINLFADLIIASWLPAGSISYLYYADRLNQLPLGMVGIAVGTALLPMLSKALAGGEKTEAHMLFNRALEISLLLALPAAVALIVAAEPIIKVLFERGEFNATNTDMTAKVLMGYALGLPAYIAIKVFSTAFWSRQDTMTPVKIAIFCTLLNIALALLLIGWLGVAGIALATGIAGWVQFILMKRGLKDMETAQFDDRLKQFLPRVVLSALVMGGVLFGVNHVVAPMYDMSSLHKLCALGVLVGSGFVSYILSVALSGALNIHDIQRYLVKKK